MRPHRVQLPLLIASGLAALSAWFLRPDLSNNGLQAEYGGGQSRIERAALITSNDNAFDPDQPLTARWTGTIYQIRPREAAFHVPADSGFKLEVGGQPVTASTIVLLPAGSTPITLEITTPRGGPYFQAGLEWQSPLGWRLVPAAYLYPGQPDPAFAQSTIRQYQVSLALGWMAAALALALCAWGLWARRDLFKSRTAYGLFVIVLLAFALRLVFLRDYAAQPGADVLGIGSDQRGYQANALEFLRGYWPQGAFYVQPGMSLALGAIYSLFGPHIRIAQLLQMIGGALITLAIFDIARRAFDSTTGWIAALLWAIFPLPIFYEAQLLTHGLEAPVGALLIWLWILVAAGFPARRQGGLESPPHAESWFWLIALGLALGAAAVLRPTFLILAPFIALSLFFQTLRSSVTREAVAKSVATSVAILALITLIPIAPITWHNYQASGRFQLLNSSSGVTLYLGNNRDSTGLGEYSPAYWAAHKLVNGGKTTYEKQTLDDIRADPIRWAQLMARKTALYFGNAELPNNVDFYTEGAGISPLLSLLPLRFGGMITLALIGTALAFRRQNRGLALLLVVYSITQSSIIILYHVFSRFRAPIYPSITILAGWAIAETWRHVRGRRWREAALNFAAIAFSAAFVAALPNFAERVMSRPALAALPSNAITLNAPIGDSLMLLGYDPLPVAEPDAPVFITLYWQSNRPIADDLYATVQLHADPTVAQKIAQSDQPIGTGSFPDFPTSQWQAGQIVWDRYLIQIPADAPTPLALSVLVAAYDRETGRRLGETIVGPLPLTRAQPLALPADSISVGAKVGAATLAAYQAEFDDQALRVTLYWQAGQPMPEDGVVFVHLFDSAGAFITGQDSRPRNGSYSTLAWQTGEGIVDEHLIVLPASFPTGKYQIAIGMYDAATQNRLQVITASGEIAPDGLLKLGTIQK